MHITRLSSKGQLILPAEARKRFNLNKGDNIAVVLMKDFIVLKPVGLNLATIEKKIDKELKDPESELARLLYPEK
jgi:AbrB family looped-hinge helix DNA binding protein